MKIISTLEELNICFGKIHLYFSPIRNKPLFLKPQKSTFFQLLSQNRTH